MRGHKIHFQGEILKFMWSSYVGLWQVNRSKAPFHLAFKVSKSIQQNLCLQNYKNLPKLNHRAPDKKGVTG